MITIACCLGACTPPRHTADAVVQGAAARELFFTREHARQLVLWADPDEPGPTFDVIGQRDARVDTAAVATTIPAPVIPVRSADLARLFRVHPDGWAAFYVAYPGAPGIVELAHPVWSGDTLATVIVGRACGEHCFNAWCVTVRDGRVVSTVPLHIPKS